MYLKQQIIEILWKKFQKYWHHWIYWSRTIVIYVIKYYSTSSQINNLRLTKNQTQFIYYVVQPHHLNYPLDDKVGFIVKLRDISEDSGVYKCSTINDPSGASDFDIHVDVSSDCEFSNCSVDQPSSSSSITTTSATTTNTSAKNISTATTTTNTTIATIATITINSLVKKSSDVSYHRNHTSTASSSNNMNEWLWGRRLSRQNRKCNLTGNLLVSLLFTLFCVRFVYVFFFFIIVLIEFFFCSISHPHLCLCLYIFILFLI